MEIDTWLSFVAVNGLRDRNVPYQCQCESVATT